MATYDLTTLIDWLRRAVGDTVQQFREDYQGDGAKRLEIRNDGFIRIRTIEVDETEVPGDDYTLEGNRVLWGDTARPDAGAAIYIVYDRADLTDAEYIDRLIDAAKAIANLIHVHWTVNVDESTVEDGQNELMPDGVTADQAIEKLIVYKAALETLIQNATSAAKDSISIRDGDTAIDTSRGATNIAALLKQVREAFDKEHRYFVANRFQGAAVTQEG